ncbi:MAG: TolC family outer membrane protein [Hyphomicrobiaceae bacterium]
MMLFRIGRLNAGLAIACICHLAGVTQSQGETLQSVVQRAVMSNPEVAALQANRLATDEELAAAKGLGRPKVDVEAGTGYLTRDETGSAGSGYAADTWHTEVSANVSVPVFDGWKTHYEVTRQGSRVESARHRVADTANSIALQTVQAYLEVQRSGAVADVAERNVAALREILERVRSRASAGRSASAEVTQARARVDAAEAMLVEARSRYYDAMALYVSVVGEAPSDLARVGLPMAMMPATVDEAVERARIEAPSLAAVHHDVLAAEAAVGTAWSEFYPRLDLEFSGLHRNDSDVNFGDNDEFQAMVVLRKNLYNGGIDTARVREAEHRVDQAEAIAASAARVIEKEVRLAWLAMHSAADRSGYLERQLESNRALVSAYDSQFEIGQRTLLDILDLRNEIFTAEADLVTERFANVYNAYRLLGTMGVLCAELGIALPEEALIEPDLERFPLP